MAWQDAMGNCWVAQLASYNFTVLYKPGKTYIEVDTFFRTLWDRELMSEVVRLILDTAMKGCSLLAEICAHSTTVVLSFLVGSGTARQEAKEAVPKQTTPADWVEAQMQDPDLNQIIWLYKIKQLETAKLGGL